MRTVLERAMGGQLPSDAEALDLITGIDTASLMAAATVIRDAGFRNVVTYSRKVFIPLTHLCRDVCHYCTFAQAPKKVEQPYLSIEQVIEVARHGAAMGCKEALFTLGERPELRYEAARTLETLQPAVARSLAKFLPAHCQGFFRHAQYGTN